MKFIKPSFKLLLVLLSFILLYAIGILVHGTMTDYQPEDVIALKADQKSSTEAISDSILRLVIWNVGFGGLGAESNFFYDSGWLFTSGDKMVRSPKKIVEKNIIGANQFLSTTKADFFLLQEVDFDSDRSHRINQYEGYMEQLPDYTSYFAPNYYVGRVPIPILEIGNVYGKTFSGLASFSKYQPFEAIRYQLPGEYNWPMSVFHLDRCLLVQRFPIANSHKSLYLVNIHNSAYDKTGKLKKKQMDFLKKMLIAEYEKGNYVIAGGDWNQCPPFFQFDSLMENGDSQGFSQINIEPDLYPKGWHWIYDPKTPSNRKARDIYKKGETFITVIDFFLISPNLKALLVKGISQDFNFSDHQPVYMEVEMIK